MEAYICSCCGMNLKVEGDLLRCDYCGAIYEKDKAEESAAKLEEALGNAKMELIANRKRHLWDVTHEKYPSKEKVVEAANAVISISAEDFLARIYLHSHDRDPLKLNAILASSKVDTSQAAEVYRWLLPSLSARTVGPLHDFVDRHFADKERFDKATAIESEASKISQGIYEPGLPRDVFLCYSSHDMGKVVGLLDLLEQNGFACFAAFRNLRHGKGAQEDYLSAIKTAMRSCEVLVFVSSEASRSMDCDALRVELPYLIQELPDKPRVEFVIEDYGDTPFMVRRTLKKAFPSQEYCRDEEDLMVRIQEALEAKGSKEEGEAERLRRELEEAKRALESAKQSQALKEAEQRQKSPKNLPPSAVPKVEGRFVYYGEYPQSQVKDGSLLDRLKSATPKGGIISLDGKRYAALEGKYFLFEPIKWRILEREGGEALLVSDSLLDAHRYNKDYTGTMGGHYANDYARSEIREWLNKGFYQAAFALGDDRILSTEVDNSAATTDSPRKNEFACENTSDKVFLLSYQDYQNKAYGFTDNASRCCAPTDYAVARGAWKSSGNGNGYYWNRSPHSQNSHAARGVHIDGDLYSYRGYVYDSGFGVRPSLRIKLAE